MKGKLIIDGNAIYEVDEECIHHMEIKRKENKNGDDDDCEWEGCRTHT